MSTTDRSAAPLRPITLASGDAVVDVAPAVGGRIAQIRVAGMPLLVDVPADASTGPMLWGSFPMAPWAGRIRAGRFTFAGVTHQLVTNHVDGTDPDRADQRRDDRDGSDRNGADQHAAGADARRTHSIHGTVFTRPWSVEKTTATGVVMACPLQGMLDWPFPGTATQRVEVSDGALQCELTVTSGGAPFPAVVGWHPWFRAPDRLEFTPRAMYVRDEDGIPTGELVDPLPGPWDDCFVNHDPVTLVYDRDSVPVVTVTSDCDHWVVFDQMEHATCVEPQSGPPDAFNLARTGGPTGGPVNLHVVDPSTPLRRTMTISW